MIGAPARIQLQPIAEHNIRKGVEHLLRIGLARRVTGEDGKDSHATVDGVAVTLLEVFVEP